jgi:hypothetical protein
MILGHSKSRLSHVVECVEILNAAQFRWLTSMPKPELKFALFACWDVLGASLNFTLAIQ